MDCERLRQHDDPPGDAEQRVVGQGDILHRRAGLSQLRYGSIDPLQHRLFQQRRRSKERARYPDPQPVYTYLQPGEEVRHRLIGTGRVLRVVARDHLQRDGTVFDAPP